MVLIPRLMIAAPASGSGKSVIASGLMAAFASQNIVQGFKVGPDYIDPMYHTAATGRPSRNLDSWMLPPEKVLDIFRRASQGASLSLIEGVMGLFDGAGSDPLDGSSAGLAILLKAPVVLVVDCAKMSGSAAAIVHGFNTLSPSLKLSGVICNRVASDTHARWLKQAIEKQAGVPVLGCVPRLPSLEIPERHLGLFTVAERPEAAKDFLQKAAVTLANYIDLSGLLEIAQQAAPLVVGSEKPLSPVKPFIRLAVARDEAFCFYYEDNLDDLRRFGAEMVPFSPLKDEELPVDISGIYFGGGYPELYADRLSRNAKMRRQVLDLSRQNIPVYAECGGLMYLSAGISTAEGRFPLVGVLPGWCEMDARLNMGYREVQTTRDGLLCPAGTKIRGHEFHFSNWTVPDSETAIYRIQPDNPGGPTRLEGFTQGNLLASYIHLHFGSDPQFVQNYILRCDGWSRSLKNVN